MAGCSLPATFSTLGFSTLDVQKTILERDYRFFAAVLSEIDLGNIDIEEA